MTSKLIIQILLFTALAAVGWMMLKSPGGARHQAGRRLITLLFVLFGTVSIAAPHLLTRLAHLVGVGRGTDLLLYGLVVAFFMSLLSSFRRDAAQERRLTKLARRIALDTAPSPDGNDEN
ncbi:DUF2304 domain-containing protein [Actinomyces vulturis]|uniref:DUF2304 domain-containing protein n=1 Tax=Actinomyces vulturis TaxID=1857645 RepID=UPI0008345816|nr:DUF2304 domain-containing protein [Actinomyces vulturis]